MSQKRFDQQDDTAVNGAVPVLALGEAARAAAQTPGKAGEKHDEEKLSIFWRVFGGTILSMVAIGMFTLYNSIASNLAELRSELSREREARADLVKKDEFNARTSSQYERIRSFEGLKAEHEGAKARVAANAAAIEELKKDAGVRADAAKKDAAALEILKERVAGLEALRKDVAGIEVVREKVANAAADLKTMRDEVGKIQQELERNRASDLERKASRDTQHKQTEEALKELQKALQDCREKIARLEGAQPAGQPRGIFSPVTPVEPKSAGKADPDGKN